MTFQQKRESLIRPQLWFAASIFMLCMATFFGNKCIGIGHGLVGIALFLMFFRRTKEGFLWKQLRPSTWFLIAFAGASLISIVANLENFPQPFSYAKKVRYKIIIILFLLLPMVRVRVFESRKFRDLCIAAWWVAFCTTTLLALVVFFVGKPLPFFESAVNPIRVSGIYGQVMTYAYGLQFTVLALAVLGCNKSLFRELTGIPRAVLFPLSILSGLGLYFAYSRGAVASVAIALLVFGMMQSKWLLLGTVVLGFLVGTYAYHDKWAYTDEPLYFKIEDPVRINQWKAAGLTFLENPIFGVGFRTFELQSRDFKKRYGLKPKFPVTVDGENRLQYFKGHAHNNYLEAFASTGILGGISFLGFCFCWLKEAWDSTKYAAILVPLVVSFLFSGFFENTFFDSEVLNTILLLYFASQVALDSEDRTW